MNKFWISKKERNLANALALCRNLYDELFSQTKQLHDTCPLCTHPWRNHDPEDGKCDCNSIENVGPCECGRSLAWMQQRIADRYHLELLNG